MEAMSSVGIAVLPRMMISASIIDACSRNFSQHYGVWADPARGRVTMSGKALRKNYLDNDQCKLVIAFCGSMENVVAHAFYNTFSVMDIGEVVWVTQLVVNPGYRNQKVAQYMLHAALGTTCCCAGIASSHPFAVMALERAMGAHCKKQLTQAHAASIIVESGVTYLKEKELQFEDDLCLINTGFLIDHREPHAALDVLGPGTWHLGPLLEGHEFVAIVLK
jgi:hypothetical protein